jgi:hypothetical protein
MREAINEVYDNPSRKKTKTLVNKLINQRVDSWLTYSLPSEQSDFIDPKRLTTLERWMEIYPEATRVMASLPNNNPIAQKEAEMIVDTAYRRLADRDLPVIPTHDGIATTPLHEDTVNAEIKRAYSNHLGVVPDTTIE